MKVCDGFYNWSDFSLKLELFLQNIVQGKKNLIMILLTNLFTNSKLDVSGPMIKLPDFFSGKDLGATAVLRTYLGIYD